MLSRAGSRFTFNDGQNGYAATRAELRNESSDVLLREYKTSMQHCFERMFGHNGRVFQNLVADELLSRKITHFDALGQVAISASW